MNLPADKQTLLDDLVKRLSSIPGVRAVVLGGSYARGMQRPDSDLDVGIYYSEREPFSIADIRSVAAQISTQGVPAVTDFYGWGPWVNGGAWIHTAAGKVDFIYRNLEQVQRAIDDARQGVVQHDFNQQPAYGFYSVIYLAETQACVPLFDPENRIARMKEEVAVYPPRLKAKWTAGTLWMAEFSLIHAEGFAASANVYATVGALTRTAAFLTQALFALNETYFMGDKTAMREIAAFAHAPEGCVERLSAILAQPGQSAVDLLATVRAMRELWAEAVALTGGSYKPAFRVG
jgi:predicted nucleotidyltransferase